MKLNFLVTIEDVLLESTPLFLWPHTHTQRARAHTAGDVRIVIGEDIYD